jgi:hypothetical protein
MIDSLGRCNFGQNSGRNGGQVDVMEVYKVGFKDRFPARNADVEARGLYLQKGKFQLMVV